MPDTHKHSHSHTHDSKVPLRVFVVTVSDTRTDETDEGGKTAMRLLGAEHEVTNKLIVQDDKFQIRRALLHGIAREHAQLVLFTGGTGLTSRDVTYEALMPLIDKELQGFGEAFRRLSFDEIGPRAILSRALAGSVGQTLVVALPGNVAAVELAISKLVLPMARHAVALLEQR